MRVSEWLGLEDDGALLRRAREAWAEWCAYEPALRGVAVDDLRVWLQRADPVASDDVLLALAKRAATDGRDEHPAASLLAWALLPGAHQLAADLHQPGVDVSRVVASQLWIEVRSFPWRRLRKVAANILRNTRSGVLLEVGAVSQLRRSDPCWHSTDVVDPGSQFWHHVAAGYRPRPLEPHGTDDGPSPRRTRLAMHPRDESTTDPIDELLGVLDEACERGVISVEDRALLLCLVEEAGSADVSGPVRQCGGMLAAEVTVPVARRLGLSEPTVRRRASRSIRALAVAHGNAA